MIYDLVAAESPVQQGDIFRDIPRVEISLAEMTVLAKGEGGIQPQEMQWRTALTDPLVIEEGRIRAVLPIYPVCAIVITQSCDAIRSEALSLCEIAPLSRIFRENQQSKRWVNVLTRQTVENLRWFYLPESKIVGFDQKMAIDFRTVISIPRTDVESLRALRTGRLNSVAYEHFREKLAEFFRRYPVNPWYPLTKDEFEQYVASIKEDDEKQKIEPYDWQK